RLRGSQAVTREPKVAVRWMFATLNGYNEHIYITCESHKDARQERTYRHDILLEPVGPIVRVVLPLPQRKEKGK
ncbi:MAG: hypothetical protein WCJ30_25375, partial [Deltaproteobacteria bacterium]